MSKRKEAVRAIIVVTVLLVISSAAVLAQESGWSALQQAKGQIVTIVRNDSQSQTGSLEQISADSITINTHERSSVISREDIRRIYLRGKRSRKRGALWGLALGAGGGAIVGAAANSPCSPSTQICFDIISRGQSAAGGAVVGAVVGTAVGALIGGGHKKTLLYDTKNSVPVNTAPAVAK